MKPRVKLIRVATVAISLDILLKGQLKYLNHFFKVIALSGKDKNLKNVERREGVAIIPVKMNRKISLLKDLQSLIILYIRFKKEKPQIVHSITPKAGLLSMIAAKYAGVPVRIHTFTGLIFPAKQGFLKKVLIFMDKVLCKYATHIYPEGNGIKNDLLKYKITNKPLKIIANGNVNGIDLEYFAIDQVSGHQQIQLKKELSIGSEDFVFIFVGRIVGDKGINELVAAFEELKNLDKDLNFDKNGDVNLNEDQNSKLKIQNFKLLLVGPLETDLDPLKKETLEEIESNSNIISVGYQNDVRPYFAISDALVFPSYREGFPNVVLQAGAMGLPSIVSNINGCNEIIEDTKNGLIIPVKNQEAIYQAMVKIMLNKTMKKNARDMIANRFEQKVVWEALLKEYKMLENNV